MKHVQNLRIGTKLAITSILAIGLVALMILLQMTGNSAVRGFSAAAFEQQAITQSAAEAKASVRGMQIGIRDTLLSMSSDDLQKAARYFGERKVAALRFSDDMARLSHSPEIRQRIARLTTLVSELDKSQQQIRDCCDCSVPLLPYNSNPRRRFRKH